MDGFIAATTLHRAEIAVFSTVPERTRSAHRDMARSGLFAQTRISLPRSAPLWSFTGRSPGLAGPFNQGVLIFETTHWCSSIGRHRFLTSSSPIGERFEIFCVEIWDVRGSGLEIKHVIRLRHSFRSFVAGNDAAPLWPSVARVQPTAEYISPARGHLQGELRPAPTLARNYRCSNKRFHLRNPQRNLLGQFAPRDAFALAFFLIPEIA